MLNVLIFKCLQSLFVLLLIDLQNDCSRVLILTPVSQRATCVGEEGVKFMALYKSLQIYACARAVACEMFL
jgi:hypothetical protein